MKIKNDKAGVSLIIAIIFVSALMLVTASLYEVQSKVWQSISNRENESKALFLTKSALELASYWAASHGVGESTPEPVGGHRGGGSGGGEQGGSAYDVFRNSFLKLLTDSAESVGIQNCAENDCVWFRVLGRSTSDAEQVKIGGTNGVGSFYYSIPSAFSEDGTAGTVRGTGDMAESCGADALDANDPCHWNKLKFGENVDIPLYYESDANGDGAIGADETHAVDLSGGYEFKLRIRTPCDVPGFAEPVGGCLPRERIVLYPRPRGTADPYLNPAAGKDPVLIQWMIADAEGTSTLLAMDVLVRDPVTSELLRPALTGRDRDEAAAENTDLSGGRINAANPDFFDHALDDFIVLEKDHKGKDIENRYPKLFCFLNPRNSGCNEYSLQTPSPSVLSHPILRLNLVGRPRKEDNDTHAKFTDDQLNDYAYDVPFLEYQLLLSSNAFSDSKSELIGFSNVAGFHKEFRLHKKRPASLSNFALESF